MNIVRTTEGYLFGEETLLPFGFNPQKDIDPIALHYLEELFDGDHIDVEFLSFRQKGTVIQTPTHQIPVTKSGLYLMRVRHPESDYDGVQFVRIMWLDEMYRGTRREPYVHTEHTIDLPHADPHGAADRIKETFEKTISLAL